MIVVDHRMPAISWRPEEGKMAVEYKVEVIMG